MSLQQARRIRKQQPLLHSKQHTLSSTSTNSSPILSSLRNHPNRIGRSIKVNQNALEIEEGVSMAKEVILRGSTSTDDVKELEDKDGNGLRKPSGSSNTVNLVDLISSKRSNRAPPMDFEIIPHLKTIIQLESDSDSFVPGGNHSSSSSSDDDGWEVLEMEEGLEVKTTKSWKSLVSR